MSPPSAMSAGGGDILFCMDRDLISELELKLQQRAREQREERSQAFNWYHTRENVSSGDAETMDNHGKRRLEQLTLEDHQRPPMPFTKDKYLVKENDHMVAWEREVRKFLRKLSPRHGHRVSAVMIYEWATGISTKDLKAENGPTTDLKRINRILVFYFGKPYMTYIMGRKVKKAYRVPVGFLIRRRRPMSLLLYAEQCEGVLYP